MAWRYLSTQSATAAFNMAVDSYLFEQYKSKRQPVLRIYRWQNDCISLGRNQKLDSCLYLENCQEDNIELVRRPTGGQAIFHHKDELSYSLVASLKDIGASCKIKDAYHKICLNLIELYSRLGLEAAFASSFKQGFRITGNLCFASWEDDDIIVAGRKVGGNAQRRSKDIVLQHGSIPLSFDAARVSKYVQGVPEDITLRTVALNELLESSLELKELEIELFNVFNKNFKLYKSELDDCELDEINRRIDETRLA